MTGFRLIEGFMPIQVLGEMAIVALLFIGMAYLLERQFRIKINKLAQAIVLFGFSVLYFKFRIYPPIPFSVRAIYAVLVLIGIFLWVSSTEESWKEFRKPILVMLDGETVTGRSSRVALVVLLPCVIWLIGWNAWTFKVEDIIELRTVHPAPPSSFRTVQGETIILELTENPFRANVPITVQKRDAEGNPWEDAASPYLRSIREGGVVYFQECHYCHGANLSGKGIFAFAFNPYPTNFTSLFKVMRPYESDQLWRVARGGLAMPKVAFPWSSVMPPMEQHLSLDDMWKVVLFEYWHTGYYPMTFD